MGKEINGYRMEGEFSNKNAGSCRWGFCEKMGRGYFIKEFLSPVYPESQGALSPEQVARKRRLCDKFCEEKRAFYQKLSFARSGNNVIPLDFFRFGSRYYAVTDRVDAPFLSNERIAGLDGQRKRVLIRSVLYSAALFHKYGVVHADIKPENILVKETRDRYCTAKIIDFDAGFLEGQDQEEVHGDLVFFSPEAYLKTAGESCKLTGKIDIFALGLVFHLYWCGSLPKWSGDYHYAFEAVLDGAEIRLDPAIPDDIRGLIQRMLLASPDERPGAQELLDELNGSGTVCEPEPSPVKTPANWVGGVKMKGFK